MKKIYVAIWLATGAVQKAFRSKTDAEDWAEERNKEIPRWKKCLISGMEFIVVPVEYMD